MARLIHCICRWLSDARSHGFLFLANVCLTLLLVLRVFDIV